MGFQSAWVLETVESSGLGAVRLRVVFIKNPKTFCERAHRPFAIHEHSEGGSLGFENGCSVLGLGLPSCPHRVLMLRSWFIVCPLSFSDPALRLDHPSHLPG